MFTIVVFLACSDNGERAVTSGSVTLTFEAFFAGQPLQMDGTRQANPTGTGEIEITDFKLYLSNVVLGTSETGNDHVESDSYHLARFDNPDSTYRFTVENVPEASYGRLEFGIGVDAQTNLSIDNTGDLDPNNQMAWNWNVGYKFVVLEGNYYPPDTTEPIPLVFHIGFSDNYKELSYTMDRGPLDVAANSDATVGFEIELTEFFKNPTEIDLQTLSSVMFNPADVAMVANNYADMITLAGQ
ncbi:MAG: hypothetical protein MJE77_24850 [Proteobacteria bacterium]|nr:hypothetical protein [Pseudomonadota bacterium]